MRRRRRRKNQRSKQIIIISTMCLFLCLCVGYAAFQTNISISAKGNIIDNTVDITENIVISGDGLYKDEYEDDRYVYKGTDPNNYIWFNKEMWRIIAKESDDTYKIIKNELLDGTMRFDTGSTRTIGYCSGSSSYGCNAWATTSEFTNGNYSGSVDADSTIKSYLNGEYYNDIDDEYKGYIVEHAYNIGAVTYNNTDLQAQITGEKTYTWTGYVGLISHSDYLRANSNVTLCGTDATNKANYETCRDYDWMYTSDNYWYTLSPYANSNYNVWRLNSNGQIGYNSANYLRGVRPVVFLSSSITLTGEGTAENPYQIS